MSATRGNLKRHTAIALVAAALLVGGISFYQKDDAHAADTETALAPQAPSVDVTTLVSTSAREWNDYSGRLMAVDYVEIRPRVGGTIQEVAFEDGDIVKKGDLLFVIDPRPFKAAVSRAEAQVVSARSQVTLADAELKRAADLVETNVIAKSAYDKRNNDFQVASAALQSAEAELTTARLNLEYAYVKAPVSGVVSRAEITEGNVIEAGASAPVLTTLVSTQKLYAEFDVDERTYLKAKRQTATGDTMPVQLSLAGDNSMTYKGELYSFDNKLDLRSGTIRARALIDNADGVLTPGMFAAIRMGSAEKAAQLLVSDRAVGTDQDKKFVYVVSPDNQVEYREVNLGRNVGGQRVVLSGLEAGERVIVNGLQRVHPAMTVVAVEAGASATATATASVQ